MGNEASKPGVSPPEDWEPKGATRAFEMISPCSDISNPSDFNRVRYHQHQPQIYHNNNQPSSPNRKLSRGLGEKDLPIATKVRKSNSTESKGRVLPPDAFYFPTEESERRAEYAEKKELVISKIVNSLKQKENNIENKLHRARKAAKKIIKKKIALNRVTACLEIKNNRREDSGDIIPKLNSAEELVRTRRSERKHPTTRSRRRSEQIADGDLQSTVPLSTQKSKKGLTLQNGKDMKEEEEEKYDMKKDEIWLACHGGKTDRIQPELNPEDSYFNRLSLSPQASHTISPFCKNSYTCSEIYTGKVNAILEKNFQTSSDKSTSTERVLGNNDNELSRHNLTSSADTTLDHTPANQRFRSIANKNFIVEKRKDEINNSSPVNNFTEFYTKTGPIDSSPQTYCSEKYDTPIQVFSDENSDSSIQKDYISETYNHDALKRQSQESQSSLFTNESKSFHEINKNSLKVLVHEDKVVHQKKSSVFSCTDRSEGRRGMGNEVTVTNRKSICKEPKISKLESLFRPILPALSTDDAHSLSSYDPYEIKVTESAPSVIQAANYISLSHRNASFRNTGSIEPINNNNKLDKLSPSMSVLSIDTQRDSSPTYVTNMVSDQAQNNGEFLFTDGYRSAVTTLDSDKLRDDHTFSISTAESRSRFTQRSAQQGVSIPTRSYEEAGDGIIVDHSYKSERRVRFSEDSANFQEKTKLKEVEEETSEKSLDTTHNKANSSYMLSSLCEGITKLTETEKSDPYESKKRVESNIKINKDLMKNKTSKALLYKGEESLATMTKDSDIVSVNHSMTSPFPRFQAATDKWGTKVACSDSITESIDLPEIENKMSDVTEVESYLSHKISDSAKIVSLHQTSPDNICEEMVKEEQSPDTTSIHWAYNENGVTPYVEGEPTSNQTKSPYFRFKDAKNKFNIKDSRGKVPIKSPRVVRRPSSSGSIVVTSPKILRKGSGGLVSTRIQELNIRVSEIRKLKRMRKKLKNPRLHTHNFDNKQPVRSRALINYKTTLFSANIENSNNVMAAKFNVIPDVDDDSVVSLETNAASDSRKKNVEDGLDDDISRMSEMTGVTSVATVRQQRNSRDEVSMSSRTTTSSGLVNLKKQVFRGSDCTRSLISNSENSENTTLSAIIHKENANYLPFRATSHSVKPSEQHFVATPQAMKWRSLAAAAAEKDAALQKASDVKPMTRLATRSNNCQQYHN